MTRGSKFGTNPRAEHRLKLLRDINTMRALGYRFGTDAQKSFLSSHETKLFELDAANGYDRVSWQMEKRPEHFHVGKPYSERQGQDQKRVR